MCLMSGGGQVGQADDFIAGGCRINLSRPPCDERNTVPSLPVVTLAAAKFRSTEVLELALALNHVPLRPVVTGDD